ncbi:hypothetical protein [Nonlabens sp.]|uniref:hypothetical protein n=1 Tax=Nonlabens sp. TaxID=1888209 RepID=UPI0025D92513|nr:hypothetical protein [Nonlabens sp.]
MFNSYYSIVIGTFFSSISFAQVGIGTSTPTSDLEIVSKTTLGPGEFNGIIIPKVAVLPTPTTGQKGLILYLESGTDSEGFYFFNGSSFQNLSDNAINTPAFYKIGTFVPATNTTENVQREGNINIGGSLSTGKLNIEIESTDPVATRTALRIDNSNVSTSFTATYAIYSENTSSTTGNKYGIKNDVSSDGIGDHIGIENKVYDSGSATTSLTGINNDVGTTNGTSSINYGLRSEIGSANSRGTNYAIYAYAQHGTTTTDPSYSGYFRGDRFAIRNEEDSDGYEMPTLSGTAGQVLTIDGTGVANWEDLEANKSIVRGHLGTLWQSSTGSSNPGDYLKIPFDHDPIDTKNEFDTTTNRFTAAQTGYYMVSIQVSSNDFDGDSTHGLAIYKGVSLVSLDLKQHTNFGSTSQDRINRSLTDIIHLNAGEFLEFRFNDNFATFDGSSEKNYFTIYQL